MIQPTESSSGPGLPPTPALGRFGPLAFSVAAIAAISMGLIAWSHVGWNRLQQRAHAFDTRLLEARQETRHTRWLHTLSSAATIPVDSLTAPLHRAENVLLGLQDQAPEPTLPALQRAREALQAPLAAGVCGRQRERRERRREAPRPGRRRQRGQAPHQRVHGHHAARTQGQ